MLRVSSCLSLVFKISLGLNFLIYTLAVVLDIHYLFVQYSFSWKNQSFPMQLLIITIPSPNYRHNHITIKVPHLFGHSDWFRDENLTQARLLRDLLLNLRCTCQRKGVLYLLEGMYNTG